MITAVWLRCLGDEVQVCLEVNGFWREVISEPVDGKVRDCIKDLPDNPDELPIAPLPHVPAEVRGYRSDFPRQGGGGRPDPPEPRPIEKLSGRRDEP